MDKNFSCFGDELSHAFKQVTGKELEIKRVSDVFSDIRLTCQEKSIIINQQIFMEHNKSLISFGGAKFDDFDWVSIWIEKIIKGFELN